MKKKPASKSAFFNQRVLIGFSFCLLGLVLALLAFAAYPGGNAFAKQEKATAPAQTQTQTALPVTSSAFAPVAEMQSQSDQKPANVLYDQTNSLATTVTRSQNFDASSKSFDLFAADDFVVPAGQAWTINQVNVQGRYLNEAERASSVNVTFYSDSANSPGVAVSGGTYTNLAMTDKAGNFTIALPSGCTLRAGTYWVSVRANMDFNKGGQWGWLDRTVQSNSGAVWQSSGGESANACANGWGAKTACVAGAAPDNAFQLVGSVVTPEVITAVLYDQNNSASTASTVSQNFEAALDANDAQTADDFVVPAGQTWTIQQVAVTAVYFNGPGPAVSFNVFFYNNAAGLPGTLVAGGSQLNATYTNAAGIFTVTLPANVVLPAGTYWVAVQANMDFAGGALGEWGWTNRTVLANIGAAWINPGGAFATPCGTAWGRRTTCITGDAAPDQMFQLLGTLGGGSSPTPTATVSPGGPTPSATASVAPPTPTPSASASACPAILSENFDGVTAPALPAGWTTTFVNGDGDCTVGGALCAAGTNWVTNTTTPDTAPNDAFHNDPACVTDSALDTPTFAASASQLVTFRHNFITENTFDGGVLEVSSPNIAGGAFTDVTNPAVGGSFVVGGYTGAISANFLSPIAGRMAWTGTSAGGYITTTANLGPNVAGQNIKLRFRMTSDCSVSATGWRVDTFSVTGACGPTPTPSASVSPGTPTPSPTVTPGVINCTAGPGLIIHDDGTEENGYGGNAATVATFNIVDKFTPATFPASVQSACVAFLTQAGSPTTLNYSVIVIDDDGAGGAPGTELGTIADVATAIPGGLGVPLFQTTDLSSLGITVTSGSVYIGVRYTPGASPNNVFVAADQSTTNPAGFAGGFERFDLITPPGPGAWTATLTNNAAYRSMMIRATLGTGGGVSPTPGGSTPTPSASASPCTGGNLVADGGFEAGSPWAAWTVQTSTNFGSSICDTTLCNINGGLTAPRTGNDWNWFGGGTGGAVEDSTTGQSFVIPAGATSLHFWMNIQTVVTPFTDTVQVKVDGTTVQTFTEPATAEGVYTERVIDLSAFANGASHSLVFVYHSVDGASNFLIDDISTTGGCASPTPGGPTATPTASSSPTPCGGAWTAGPSMPPAAVLRSVGVYFPANQRFYSVGGRSSDLVGSDLPNPFEYNPGTNAWTTTAAVLPDLMVNNMACGVLTVSSTPQIYCVGGSQATVTGTAARVFSYNPVSNATATLTGDDWPGAAGGFLPGGFAVHGNKLYIIGGIMVPATGNPVVTNQVWQFDPTAAVGSKWVARANFPVSRGYVPAATIGNFIYTAGGSDVDPTGLLLDTAGAFRYDPVADTWSAAGFIPNIPRVTAETRAVVFNGKMWVLGGGRTVPNPSAEVDVYDPVANSWSTDLPFDGVGRRNFAADSNGTDRIFLAGGYDNAAAQVNTMRIFTAGACPSPSPTIAPTPTPTIEPSVTPGVTATPGVSPTPSETPGVPSPTATASATAPAVSPTPTPGTPAQAVNFSTRMKVLVGGSREGIGGFIVTGGAKQVLVRAIGPSLVRFGITDAMADPTLELHGPTGFTTLSNNDWRSSQQAAIEATGLPPTHNLESAILVTLNPGQYTAIVRGVGNTEGVALIEVYDLSQASGKLANISTRAFVGTGDDVIIAGFILGNNGGADNVIVRGMGPSLAALGVQNVLANPTLELRDNNGALLLSDNDWQDNADQKALIQAAGLAPSNNLEAAIFATLPPGLYTAIVAGLNKTTGNGLVEVYDLGSSGGGGPSPTPGGPSPTPGASPSPGGPSPTPGESPTPGIPSPTPPPASPTPPTASPTPSPTTCTESFDSVTAPALPSGWVATIDTVGDPVPPSWETSTVNADSAPNELFVVDQNQVSDKWVDSRNITISSSSSVLSFRNFFNTEYDPPVPGPEHFWDGYVLEVSTDAGATFQDIIAAGGVFTSGPYVGEIDGTAGNPLAGRPAWCGASGGVPGAPVYINTQITLPASMNGQTIKLRFRMATDEAQSAEGARVDSLTITGASCPP